MVYLYKMKFRVISLFFVRTVLSFFAFISCKNDLKLNAPYKEVPSVYAVLNPQDRIQIIRVNKVFLGVGNANVMAQVADSINYPAGELTITLNRFVNDNQVNAAPGKLTITCRDSMVQASSGAFNSNQRVYVFSDDLHQGTRGQSNYHVSGDYVLTIKNNRTGNVFTSKATAIDSISGNQGIKPLTIAPLYPYPAGTIPSEYVDYAANNGTVRFVPNEAQLYQLIIRMHFYDSLRNTSIPSKKIYNYIDYTFGNKNLQDVQNLGIASYIVFSFRPTDVFGSAGVSLSHLNLNNDPLYLYGRKMYKIQFFIYSTTQDYSDYLQFISPSLSISQIKPLYSNFENQAALGIFTFRARCVLTKEMSTGFVSEFAYNSNTCSYRFFTSAFQLPGCN